MCSVILFLTRGSTILHGVEVVPWSVVPIASRAALQLGGTVAAGELPVFQHVAVCNAALHSLARTSAILCFISFKAHGLPPPGPNHLLKLNLSSWSRTSVYLLQFHFTLLTHVLQRSWKLPIIFNRNAELADMPEVLGHLFRSSPNHTTQGSLNPSCFLGASPQLLFLLLPLSGKNCCSEFHTHSPLFSALTYLFCFVTEASPKSI